MGGAVLGSADYVNNHLQEYLRQTGPTMSPFNAWVMLKGLETMPVRVQAQTATATKVADYLIAHNGVTRVLYCGHSDHPQADIARRQMTGGGQIVTFEVVGGKAAAFRFQNALSLIKLSNNLGDAKSLVTHPATTTHYRIGPQARAELGISDGMLRLSVGLEAFEDLAADLETSLEAARNG